MHVHSTSYENSRVATNKPARLRSVWGYNSKTAAQFIQIHDATSVPNDGAVPVVTIYVAAESNFSIEFDDPGITMVNGIVVCNSSTGATKTIGSNDCWFNISFL